MDAVELAEDREDRLILDNATLWVGDGSTFHGYVAISHEHLDDYLDEFTFRFNRRSSASRGKLFFRLAQQAVLVEPAPFESLVSPKR